MPAQASPAPSHATDLAVALAVAVGAVLTVVGWTSVDPSDWRVAEHGRYFLVLWAITAGLVASRRLSPLGAGAATLVAVAAAAGGLGAALSTLALGWSAATLGRALLGRSRDATWTEGLLVGLAIYATVVGLLVHAPVNYPGTYALMLAAPLVLARRTARALLVDSVRAMATPTDGTPTDRTIVQRVLASAAGAVAGVHLLVAMMPEIGHDALVTHLLLPERVCWDHVWSFDVDRNVWAVAPMAGDWLFTIGHMFAGETGARLVNVGCIFVVARLVHELARWAGADRTGRTAATLLYLVTPLTLTETSSLFIESVWTCFVVGGAAAIFRAGSRDEATRDPRHLAVAGAVLGGALATKAVTFVVLPVLFVVLVATCRRWLRRDHVAALVVGAVAFAVIGGLPYVRAYLITGNPVFPFYNGLFQSPFYPPENFSPPPMFARGTSWDVLYRITFESGRYLEARPGAAGFHWLLLVVPTAIGCLLVRHRRGLLLLGVAAGATYLTFRETAYLRYVFPSFALVAACVGVALGGGLGRLRAGRLSLALATVAVVALDLVYFGAGGYYATLDLPALASESGRAAYLARRRPLREAVRIVDRLNTNGAPVAFFCQSFGTGLHADGLWTNWYNHRFATRARESGSALELGQLLAREGVQYLLLRPTWRDGTPREYLHAVSDEVHAVGDVSIRRLREEYRFRDEVLAAPGFDDASSWHLADGAAVEAGRGVRVTSRASATQQVQVVPGREYRLSARVRRADAAVDASARLQINWLDGELKRVRTDLQVVACDAQASLHSMDVHAPERATSAVVYATGHTEQPVVFESLSLRN